MNFLRKFGWAVAIFGALILIGQLWADIRYFSVHPGVRDAVLNVRGAVTTFIQLMWFVILWGGIGIIRDKYWARWTVLFAGLFILTDILTNEVLPALSYGVSEALTIAKLTAPGIIMGRGPVTLVILTVIVAIVTIKGLARAPSRASRAPHEEHLRTRKTDGSSS